MLPRFARLHLARTLQQDARDNLKAIRDTVLYFVQQQLFFADKIVTHFIGQALRCDIGDREHDSNAFSFKIIERMGIYQKPQRVFFRANQIHFININCGFARDRGLQQRV